MKALPTRWIVALRGALPAVVGMLLGIYFAGAGSVSYAQSLFDGTSFQSVTADAKAHRIGDPLTVVVYETASARSSAGTGGDRASAMGATVATSNRTRNYGVRTNSDTESNGNTERSGKVLAQLTVTVRDIGANGELVVGGEQYVEINGERQKISVEGRVRTRDISDQNTVISSRLANARISYLGAGDVADRQAPSWWQKFVTWFGL